MKKHETYNEETGKHEWNDDNEIIDVRPNDNIICLDCGGEFEKGFDFDEVITIYCPHCNCEYIGRSMYSVHNIKKAYHEE